MGKRVGTAIDWDYGVDGHPHDWQGIGGCIENPGVWSRGGTGRHYRERCRLCQLERARDTDYEQQRDSGWRLVDAGGD